MNMKRKVKIELNKKQYLKFIEDIIVYNSKNQEYPQYITIDERKIYKNEYIEAMESTNKFILENGRYPEKVIIYNKKHNHQ